MDTKFWILHPAPITTPESTKADLPRTQRSPIRAPLRTWAKCQTLVPAATSAPSSTTAVGWISGPPLSTRGSIWDCLSWRVAAGKSRHEHLAEPECDEGESADRQQDVVGGERFVAKLDRVRARGDRPPDEARRDHLRRQRGAIDSP